MSFEEAGGNYDTKGGSLIEFGMRGEKNGVAR